MELIRTPTIYARKMNPSDENKFIRLCNSTYGKTYSYKNLYKKTGYTNLIKSNNIVCFGQFDMNDNLIGHTGFFFNFKENFAYSGLSMRTKSFIKINKIDEIKSWELILNWVSQKVSYLHQNTTTYHLLAQIYSLKILNACPTGLIIDYTVGERLENIETPPTPMQALTQTSILIEEKPKKVLLPNNYWSDWISLCFEGTNRNVSKVLPFNTFFSVESIETNPQISLQRRRVVFGKPKNLTKSTFRTDLIHFPCNGNSFEKLLNLEYLPVGIMLNYNNSDDIVFQYLPIKQRIEKIKNLQKANTFSKKSKQIFSRWINLCKQTLNLHNNELVL